MEQPQQITPADQLVHTSKFQEVGRCNNYAALPNILCLKECRIVGKLLVDHDVSYALTITTDIPAVYLQLFWKTVKKVLNANETICFMVNKQEITYTVDMFPLTLKLPVETPEQQFIPPGTLEYIQPFLKIIGYQGLVDKVSAFYTKNLAQPWQIMFKVFNHCLTSRTFGHDQTKIKILQIFHFVVNKVHVDYASLLWWDFIHCVQQKKSVIQYPRFIKLIIADIMSKTPNHADVVQNNKGKQFDKETSLPKPSLKIHVKQQKLVSTTPPPSSDDQELDDIHEATLLRLALHKTAKIVEEQENVVVVEEQLLKEDVEKIVEGKDEESYASEFTDLVFLDEEDSGTRIEPGRHKENPKTNDDDDDDMEKKDDKKDDNNDNDDHDDQTLIRTRRTGSLEVRTEKMQTPIPSPPRSSRKDLSLEKAIAKELMVFVSITPVTSTQDHSKPSSNKRNILLGSIAQMARRRGQLRRHMNNTFVTNCYFQEKMKEMPDTLNNLVPELIVAKTNELIKEVVARIVNDAVKQDRESSTAIVPELIS
ncbi:hypothetical protein Tco_1554502 [Tanacetum coccineum]